MTGTWPAYSKERHTGGTGKNCLPLFALCKEENEKLLFTGNENFEAVEEAATFAGIYVERGYTGRHVWGMKNGIFSDSFCCICV